MLIDEATTSLRTGWSSSASSSTPVPAVLASAYSAGSYMLWPTPTRAARCTTESTPSSAPRMTSALRTSPASSSASEARYSGRCESPCTCSSRLSSTRTPWPARKSSSTRCEPMNPAPPVTKICSGTRSAPPANPGPPLARDHAPPGTTLALAKATSLGRGRVRPLAWCSRPRNWAGLPEEALGREVCQQQDERDVPGKAEYCQRGRAQPTRPVGDRPEDREGKQALAAEALDRPG